MKETPEADESPDNNNKREKPERRQNDAADIIWRVPSEKRMCVPNSHPVHGFVSNVTET